MPDAARHIVRIKRSDLEETAEEQITRFGWLREVHRTTQEANKKPEVLDIVAEVLALERGGVV